MKYEGFVKEFYDVRSVTGEEAMAICVHHDDHSASLQINMQSGLWLCFSCGARGGPRRLMEAMGVIFAEPEEDLQYLSKRLRQLAKADRSTEDEDTSRVFEESYLKRFEVNSPYWLSRGIGPLAQKTFQLGYYPMDDFHTIPLRNMERELLGVIKRFNNEKNRYRYPKGFVKSHHLFASWLVAKDPSIDHVILTEGSLDAIKVWQAGYPAMAIYGSQMSTQQIRLLRRLGIMEVTLFFDNDKGGRQATRSCAGWTTSNSHGQEKHHYNERLDLKRDFFVDVVRWNLAPPKIDGKRYGNDPGDLTSDQITAMLEYATPLK